MLFVLRAMQNTEIFSVKPGGTSSNYPAPPTFRRVLIFVDGRALASWRLCGRYEFLADQFGMLVPNDVTCYIICNEVVV
jgi:hypothetical protein